MSSATFSINMRVLLYIVVLIIYLAFSGVQADIGDDCQLASTNSSGQCTLLQSCPGVLKDIKDGKNPQICGFQEKVPIVCCVETKEEKERISRKKCEEYAKIGPTTTCPPFPTPLISSGFDAQPKEYPHMALLGYASEDNIKWQCFGALISEQFVLTAAHCLFSRLDGQVNWVRLGDLNIATTTDDAQPQEFSVVERIKHPQFAPPSRYHDIGLLKLNQPVAFTQYVRPACLYTGHPVLREKQRYMKTSWNSDWDLESNSEHHGVLERRALNVITHNKCNESYANNINRLLKFGILSDSQICAASIFTEKACQGDSGGPLQIYSSVKCMYDIVGLTSFGSSCGNVGLPDVYTRVSHYLDWIEKTVWP